MNKKGNVLTSYARAGRAPGCDNNVISSRGTSREEKSKGLPSESSPSSFLPRQPGVETRTVSDIDCQSSEKLLAAEMVVEFRRVTFTLSLRPFLPGFHRPLPPPSRKLATAATSYRRDIRCIRTSFPLNLKSSLRRHSSGRSSNSTGNLTMPKVAPIKSAVSRIRLSDSIRGNFFLLHLSDHLF